MPELTVQKTREQELADSINDCFPKLYAEVSKKSGVTVYLLDPDDVECHDDLIVVSDKDTDMASVIYDNFNAAKVQDISEQLWSQLYRKIEEFVEENRKVRGKRE
ncbi:hypothetical protein PS395_08730 [Limosilactobacillus pontis]|uniref:hypothetical protein n=1 Tax=Limosilactobacillus pontis TaxID=35787 RepID=UPI002F268B07